jgi:hypothetical protein
LGTNGGTTTALNTTGADFVIVALSQQNGTAYTITDNFSNSFQSIRARGYDSAGSTILLYPTSFSVSTSSYTVTVSGTALFNNICISAWSGIAHGWDGFSSGFGATAVSTISPGTTTPTQTGQNLVITSLACDQTLPVDISVNAGFTQVPGSPVGATGPAYGIGLAYLIQTGMASVTPTWNQAAVVGSGMASVIAAFY